MLSLFPTYVSQAFKIGRQKMLRLESLLKLLVFIHVLSLASTEEKVKSGEEKLQRLIELSDYDPLIKFDSAKFKQFCRKSPRNYSVIVSNCPFYELNKHVQYQTCGQSYKGSTQ